MPFWSRTNNNNNNNSSSSIPVQQQEPSPYQQNCYADGSYYSGNYPSLPGNAYEQQHYPLQGNQQYQQQGLNQQQQQQEINNNNNSHNKYTPQEQDEDLPMDIGDLTDIFSFEFMRGRPIWNFFLAILWCIGLPILLYHILKPYLGQVVAMVVASAPPLLIVVW